MAHPVFHGTAGAEARWSKCCGSASRSGLMYFRAGVTATLAPEHVSACYISVSAAQAGKQPERAHISVRVVRCNVAGWSYERDGEAHKQEGRLAEVKSQMQ